MNQLSLENSDLNPGLLPSKTQLIALSIPLLICLYLIVGSTVSIFPELPVYDTKRIAQFILLFSAFLITLASSSLRSAFASQMNRIPGFIGLGIILFFVLGAISSIANADSARGAIYSLVDVTMLGLLFMLTLVVAASRTIAGLHFDRAVISLITLLGLAVGVQELTGFLAAWSIGLSYSFDIALYHFSFPRMYNQLQTWTIPLISAVPFMFPRNKLAAGLCIITLGLHWYVLLETGARGSVVSLLAAFTIASLFNPLARKAIIRWQFAGILLGILIFTGLYTATEIRDEQVLTVAQPQTQNAENGNISSPVATPATDPKSNEVNKYLQRSVGRPLLHTSGRTQLWRDAINDAYTNPLLGIGPMNFACKGPMGRAGHPHNLGFQILGEWGIPAAIVLAMLGLFLLWNLIKVMITPGLHANGTYILGVLLATAALAALVHLAVSSLLLTPASHITGALIGGWLMGVLPRTQASTTKRSPMVFLSGAVIGSMLLLPFSYHETVNMPEYRQQLPVGEDGSPRLWQLGKACSNKVD